jgi:transcriptional regulator with XRE-family HTH domain
MAGITETISEGLGRYSIGEKLRSLRLRKSMGLVELGKHTGLSAALLSKLERGKLFPTLPTLLRISMVFGVGLDYFFTDERKRRIVGIVRKDERVRLPERPGTQDV